MDKQMYMYTEKEGLKVRINELGPLLQTLKSYFLSNHFIDILQFWHQEKQYLGREYLISTGLSSYVKKQEEDVILHQVGGTTG